VSGTRDQTAVSGQDWCPAARAPPGRMSARLPHAGHQGGHLSGLAGTPRTCQLVCAWPDTGPEPLLPQATDASTCGELGRCPAGMAPAARVGTRAVLPQTLPDASAAAVRHAVWVPDTCRHPRRPSSARASSAVSPPGRRPGRSSQGHRHRPGLVRTTDGVGAACGVGRLWLHRGPVSRSKDNEAGRVGRSKGSEQQHVRQAHQLAA
jgi:hypothetical protein